MSEENESNFYQPQDLDVRDDDNAIAYAQELRKGIVKGFTRGAGLTKDPEELKIVLAAVNGMANTAISNKRIRVEEKGQADNAATAQVIAQMLAKASSIKPFECPTERELPTLDPTEFPDPQTVAGETAIQPAQITYDTFMQPTEEKD